MPPRLTPVATMRALGCLRLICSRHRTRSSQLAAQYSFGVSSCMPPRPRLLKPTHRKPQLCACGTRLLMYSVCESPVSPGRKSAIGFASEQDEFDEPACLPPLRIFGLRWSMYQSSDTCPPSGHFMYSLESKE